MKSSCSYYDFGRCSSTARNRCGMYVFFGLFFQKTHIEKVMQVIDSISTYTDSSTVSFTGKETDCETGFSYFGARYYDPTLMTSFLSIDRYTDKYPSLSPYHYCAWNPIKLTDPSGDSVVFMDDNVKKMFNEVYNNVCVRMAELKSKGFKRDRHKEEYASLSNIKQSMDDVINSETNFYYYSLPNPDGAIISGGHTYGKDGINGVVLEITDMCYGTLVHETKHASQYFSGDWEFDRNNVGDDGKFRYINYDFQDEFDAHRQGFDYMFSLTMNNTVMMIISKEE